MCLHGSFSNSFFSQMSLEELLLSHERIASEISSRIKPLMYFDKYLKSGYYPFCKEGLDGYDMRIRQVVKQVLDSDYPAIDDVEPNTIRKARKMMMLLSERPPQTPNMSQLSRELELDRMQGIRILRALERAGLLILLENESASLKNMSRPEKIYCENPNLMCALVPSAERGTLRECFFCNQARALGSVNYPKQGDFLVNGKYLFEVGGHGKKFTQIKDVPDSFLAVDDLEEGYGNRIPLWCFGLLS